MLLSTNCDPDHTYNMPSSNLLNALLGAKPGCRMAKTTQSPSFSVAEATAKMRHHSANCAVTNQQVMIAS